MKEPEPAKEAERASRPSARDEAREAFRDAILSAAERVFERGGFYETRMADIAREAGVGVGTLYNYFASKELIFNQIVEARRTEFIRALEERAERPDPVDDLFAMVQAVLDHISKCGAFMAVFLESGALSALDMQRFSDPKIACGYDHFVARAELKIRAAVELRRLRDDIPAELLVAFLTGAVNGSVYSWFKRGRSGSLPAVARELFDVFLRGATR